MKHAFYIQYICSISPVALKIIKQEECYEYIFEHSSSAVNQGLQKTIWFRKKIREKSVLTLDCI
jgi:hypothetical protein